MLRTISRVAQSAELGEGEVQRVLRYVRTHLRMDVAWVARCTSAGQVVEMVDGAGERFGLRLGALLPAAIPATCRARAHAVAPLRHCDGHLYGQLGCLSEESRPALRARDDEFLLLAAALLAPNLDAQARWREERAGIGARTQAILDSGGPEIVFQPIARLAESSLFAFEALARFPGAAGPDTTDQWFTEAEQVSLRTDLEVAAVRSALTALDWLDPQIRIAVNSCPAALQHPAMVDELLRHDLGRVIIEITEHDQVADYDLLRRSCDRLRELGAIIALDDAGSGYAGLQHLVDTRPDIIKLDRSLIHDIDTDPGRAALACGLLTFARATNATVLAEGIETAAELRTLTRLGIPLGQGHHLGRPSPLPRILDLRNVPAQRSGAVR